MEESVVESRESRREQLAKAWDAVEEKDDVREGDTPAARDSGKEDVQEKSVEEPSTDDSSSEKPEEGKEAEKAESPDAKEARAAEELERKPAPDRVAERAPLAWKPAVREHWAKLPPEVRAEVARRELEIQQTLTQTGQVRRFAEDFARVVQPFSHLIRAQNSTPLQAVQNLMTTAAGLVQGSQQQKAAIVADIINNYGIDVQELDNILVQRYNPKAPQQPAVQAPPQWAQPIFGFMEEMQRARDARQQQMQMEAQEAVEAVADKPFFDDLRDDMADLMETAANRGRSMTIEQAYERALALNPEIEKIVKQRAAASQHRSPVSEAAATLARARKAASTVKGSPAGTNAGGPKGKLSRKQMLSEAWDDQNS